MLRIMHNNYPLKKSLLSVVIPYSELDNFIKTHNGRKKLVITRKPLTDNKDAKYIWVSKVKHPNAIHPSDLHIIEQKVLETLNKESVIVVLDAFEYIMMEQGLDTALKFACKLRDMALLNNSNFVVTVGEGLEEKELALLKRVIEG
jgi:hypothetical protein